MLNNIVLSIDTSTPQSYVSVWKEGKFYSDSSCVKDSHNELLSKLVSDVLLESKTDSAELAALIIGSGPGSFTGLRIGYAYAKGLSLALKIPINAYSTLESPAYTLLDLHKNTRLITLSQAGRAEYFVCDQYLEETAVRLLQPSVVLKKDALLDYLKRIKQDILLMPVSGQGLDSIFSAYASVKPVCLSESLIRMHIKIGAANPDFNLQATASMEPDYVRQPLAKTLSDRGIDTPRF